MEIITVLISVEEQSPEVHEFLGKEAGALLPLMCCLDIE